MLSFQRKLSGRIAALATLASAGAAVAQPAPPPPGPAYADLADLADSATLVVHAQVRSATRLKNDRAPGLRPGSARYFVKAKTRALLTGSDGVGEALRYLVDVPFGPQGKGPKLAKQEVLLFARPGARPGEVQLVAPDGQIGWTPERDMLLRTLLQELIAPGAPGRVTGVREVIHVPGTLAGEGETQMFLNTRDGSAASITVRHGSGGRAAWGASFSELTADLANPPREGTLAWYRLACFLPDRIPVNANLSETASARAQAERDYRMVLGELGPCPRTRP